MRRLIALFLLFCPILAQAQGVATLAADTVRLEGQSRLIAQGNVEVLYDGTKLSARRIVYDQTSDRLTIDGPIFLVGPNDEVLTARRADLDPTLKNGLLRSARLVLDQQLQLAANQISRSEGRYSQLYKTVVSSCHVCAGEAPLWDIRAESVIHDEEARQLYFRNAVFRIKGVPVIWLPRARLPDPTLERSTGFLIPRLRTTDQLSTGLKLPYFVTLGDHRDITLTPYVSSRTRTLEARYRQAFLNGDFSARGAVSQDELTDGTRSYIFAEGGFELANDFKLDFDIEAVSDPAYLLEYGYSDKDRLDSAVSLTRVRNNELFFASLTYFESLRDDEADASLPPVVADFMLDRRFPGWAGGTLTLGLSGDAIYRYGDGTGDEGRDSLRVGANAEWRRVWTTPRGLRIDGRLELRSDIYRLYDAPNFDDTVTRSIPTAALTLRYPLAKTTNRARHLLEPIIALAWSDHRGGTPPNEDSTRPEFDSGNLFALSRFPGDDAIETGGRIAAGLHWTRAGAQGSETRLTFGRVYRAQADDRFTQSSGLRGNWSDWLFSGKLELPQGIRFEGRALINDTFETSSAAAKIGWQDETVDLTASYIWLAADSDVGRDGDVAAWAFDSFVQLSDAWAIGLDARYDVDADRPTQAGLGVQYRNECVTVDLSVSRRYTNSATVDPSTDYGLSVSLNGFSAGRSGPAPRHSCDG